MEIAELQKPIGAWCKHCAPKKGCNIYPERPEECRTFHCGWLLDPDMPEELRPDRSKVVLGADQTGLRLVARCDHSHPLAWRNEPIRSYLRRMAARLWPADQTVFASAGQHTWLFTPNGEQDLGVIDPSFAILVEKRSDGWADVSLLTPDELERYRAKTQGVASAPGAAS
jgi:hypothetical protein